MWAANVRCANEAGWSYSGRTGVWTNTDKPDLVFDDLDDVLNWLDLTQKKP